MRCTPIRMTLLAMLLAVVGSSRGEAASGPEALWSVKQPGFVVETVAGGLQFPVDIAFAPHPGTAPSSPWFYVTELYGTVKVVTRDGAVRDYASGLLNFAPFDPFPGAGEIGLAGIVVEPATGDVIVSLAYQDGSHLHPEVLRLHSVDGGLSAASRSTLLAMPAIDLTTSHMASNLSFGPDGKLYVHVGDGGLASNALNPDSFGGKVLRLNPDGSAPSDNPFYNAGDGITAKDYVYALGLRNPFGGDWRAADGRQYEVENGPDVDRFAPVVAGGSLGYDGSNTSMAISAIWNWSPAHAPVNLAFTQPSVFAASGFPAAKVDHAFVSEFGRYFVRGPLALGKRISEFTLDGAGHLVAGPTSLIEYAGTGAATVVGLASGPDGLYFTDFFADQATAFNAVGAHVMRVRWVGPAPVLPTVTILATGPNASEAHGRPGVFTISRSGPTTVSLPVAYTVGGTATPGADYAPLSGFAVIPANASSVAIDVVPVQDTIAQGDLTVTATLATATAYGVGSPATATVVLHDDDRFTRATIAIDQATRFQTIHGIGGDFANGRFDGSSQPNDAVGAVTLAKLRPTHARVGIPLKGWVPAAADLVASDAIAAYHDDGRVHNVFLLMQDLSRRGIPIVASVWDAPDWMVANPAATIQRQLRSGIDDQIAAAIAAFIVHARDQYGVEVEAVGFNEANIGYALALPASEYAAIAASAGQRFQARGLATRWLAGEATGIGALSAYAAPVLADARARPLLAALGEHTWDTLLVSDQQVADVAALAQANGLPVWATEVGYDAQLDHQTPNPFPTWDNAWQLALVSHRALTVGRAAVLDVWSYQNDFPLADAATGKLYPAGEVVEQVADHLHPGAHLVAATPTVALLRPFAAVNEERNEFTAQVINTSAFPARVAITGLPDQQLSLVRTSRTERQRELGQRRPHGGQVTLTLPGRSISTLYGPLHGGRVNAAPSVDAGPDQSLALGLPVALHGTVHDDGLPAGATATSTWSLVSGPGHVAFADASHPITTATVDAPGVYLLRLSASDGALTGSDTVVISALGATLHVDFQPETAAVPPGYLPDSGAAFADRGNGFSYGWNAANRTGLDRDSALSLDQRYDTLIRMQQAPNANASWQIAVPNGDYDVHAVAGDAAAIDSTFRIVVAGTLAISGSPTAAQHWLEGTVRVHVAAGRLVVGNGAGAVNDKLCFIDIVPVASAPPLVAFHAATSTIAETSASPDAIVVELSHAAAQTVTVAYSVTGGSAVAGANYQAIAPGTLSFAPGETAKTIALQPIDDHLHRDDRTVVLTLGAIANASPGSPLAHTVTITDADALPTVAFTQPSSSHAETDGTIAIPVGLSTASGLPASVAYAITGGTAQAGGNYQPLAAGTLLIAAGSTTASIPLTLLDNHLHEAAKTVVLTLSGPSGAVLGASSYALTITDADAPPTVAFAQPAASHPESDGAITVPVALSAASGLPVTVSYAVAGGTAQAGTNYQALATGVLTIAPGTTTAAIPVTLLDDHLHDPATTLQLALSAPGEATLGAPSTFTLTIADADPAPGVAFAASTLTHPESDGAITLPVALSAPSGLPVTVSYAVTGGTAVAGINYQALPAGTLTFTPPATTAAIPLVLLDDHLHTAGTTLTVALSAPAGATLAAPATLTLTIADADPAPTVAFVAATQAVDQSVGTIAVPVALSGVSGLPAQVTVALAAGGAGTAVLGTDYTFTPGTLAFAPGSTMASIPLTVVNSGHTDDRTVILALTDPQGSTLGTTATTTITLREISVATQPTIAFAQPGTSVAETAGTVAIPVSLSAATTQAVSVAYAVTGGSAVAGANYQAPVSGTLVIPAGQTGGTIPVTVLDDHVHDAATTLTVSLSAPANATLGSPASFALTIADADPLPAVAFASGALSVDQGAGAIAIPLTLTPASGLPAQVAVAVSASGTTAVLGTDYAFTPGTVSFAPGATTGSLPLTVLASGKPDDQTVVLTLAAPQGAVPGATTSLIMIIRGTAPQPTIAFQAASAQGYDAVTTVTVPVVLSAISTHDVVVDYHVSGGTAVNGPLGDPATDIALPDGSLVVPAGQTTGQFSFSVVDRHVPESTKTVAIDLVNPVGATLGTPTTFTYTILNDDLPAPVIAYSTGTAAVVDVFGQVPDGYGITTLRVAAPASFVDVLGSIDASGVFHANLGNSVPPAASVTFSIAFGDAAGHVSPSTIQTIAFGDGSGGAITGGDPSTLPPTTPTVSLSISGGLTGQQTGQLNGEQANFTKNDQVTVTVSASTSLGTISSVQLISSDGQVIDATGGSATLPTPAEGRFEFTATAIATNGYQGASGSTSQATVLIVDKTKPALIYTLPKRYWPPQYDQSADPAPLVPLRQSLSDDRDLVLLNGNGDGDNKTLRQQRSMNVFDAGGFTVEANVVDAAGLREDINQTATATADTAYTLTVTVRPPLNPQAGDPQTALISGFAQLKDSVEFDQTYLTQSTLRGRYTMHVILEDRAGNKLDTDAFKLWVKRQAPPLKVGLMAYQGGVGMADPFDPKTVMDSLRWVVSTPDAAEAWQDQEDEGHRLRRLAATSDSPSDGGLSAWRLHAPPPVPGDGTGTATVIVRDFLGNKSSPITVTAKRNVLNAQVLGGPVSDGKDALFATYGAQLPEQPVVSTADAQTQDSLRFKLGKPYQDPAPESDLALLTPEGVREAWRIVDNSDPNAYFNVTSIGDRDAADDKVQYSPVLVNPLDPGADGDSRHATPVILTIPPSWQTNPPTVPVQVRDHGIAAVRTAGLGSASITVGLLPAGSPLYLQETSASAGPGSDSLKADLPLKRTEVDPSAPPPPAGQPAARVPASYPGLTAISYRATPQNQFDYNTNPPTVFPTYASVTGYRWLNLIELSPDVVATGNTVTVRIAAGFLDDSFHVTDFDPKGDYVHFRNGGSDITQTASAYDPSADPSTRAGKIAIAGQRLIVEGANSSLVQALELDLVIAADVPAVICDVDVKMGAVKAYTDALSAANKGTNGAHRMKMALAVIQLDCLGGHRFGSIHRKTAFRTDSRLSFLDRYVVRAPEEFFRLGDYWFITDKIGPTDPNFAIFETGPIGNGFDYNLFGCTKVGPQMYAQYQWLVDSINGVSNFLYSLGLISQPENLSLTDLFNFVMSVDGYQLDPEKVSEGRYWQSPSYTQTGQNEITGQAIVQGTAYPIKLKLSVDQLTMRVDSNADRKINADDDIVKAVEPFHFWTNTNNGYNEGVRDDGTNDISSPFDAIDSRINGIRDLIDMAPMSIDMSGNLLQQLNAGRSRWRLKIVREGTGAVKFYGLKRGMINSTTGNPSQDFSYLTYRDFGKQVLDWSKQFDLDTALKSGAQLPPVFTYVERNWFLFEGLSPGDMKLKVMLVDVEDGNKEYECDSVLVKLEDINKFYVMLNAETDLVANNPAYVAIGSTDERYSSLDPLPGRAMSDIPGDAKILIFLHGFNVDSNAAKKWFDETYKRLYWTGFKDEFVGIHWNGADPALVGGPPLKFNTNIWHAFQTGALLATWLPGLTSSHEVSMMSHSAGTVAALETLRLIQGTNPNANKIKNLITMESATFANVFTPSLPAIDTNPGSFDNLSHNSWFAPSLSMVSGTYKNFYSGNDITLYLTMCDANENLGIGKILGHASDTDERIILQAIQRNAWRMAFRIPGIHSYGPDVFGIKCVIPHNTSALGSVAAPGISNVDCEPTGFGINRGSRNLSAGSHSFMRETNYDETYLLFREIYKVTK